MDSLEAQGYVWDRGEWKRTPEAEAAYKAKLEAARLASANNPFDSRTEVSADARHIAGHIVKHLWIIFVLLPVVLGILFAILYAVVKP
jgi:hypothetical protein